MAKSVKKREMLIRQGSIEGFRTDILISADATPNSVCKRKRTSTITLEVFGTFDSPVGKLSQFSLLLSSGEPEVGKSNIPSIGLILKGKSTINGMAEISTLELQTLLTLATTGHLKYCLWEFQPLLRGSGLMTFLLFSSEPLQRDAEITHP